MLLAFISSASAQSPPAQPDVLLRHLSAAETFQIAGDLSNAALENRAIIAIALERLGNVAIEEGRYSDAVRLLDRALFYEDSVFNRTNLAVAYFRANRSDRALQEARKAVELNANFAPARYILGNIYFTQGNYEAALPELEKVMILAPDLDAARALGLTYLYLKQLDRAKLLFDEVQGSIKQESPELHILFGEAYEQTNYPLEAEREFNRALELNPRQAKANFLLGYVILQHGGSERLGEAARAFEKELAITPDDYFANFFAGVGASSENRHEQALKYLTKAAQISPQRPETYLFLGQTLSELNDLPAAERNLRRAIELETSDLKATVQARRTHFLLGRLLLKTNRKAEGEKELARAQQLQQASLDLSRNEIKQVIGEIAAPVRPAPAQSEADAAISLTPAKAAELKKLTAYLSEILARTYHNMGVIAAQTNDPQNAVENFKAALEWQPDFPGLNRNLGIINFRSGKYADAIAPLARHLNSQPNDNLIRRMLGTSYYLTGDFAGAVATLKPLEAALADDAELAYFYGIALIALKRNQEATPVFTRLAQASQRRPEALFYAAQGFMLSGDYERAAREFRTVLTLAPAMPKANYFIGQSLIRLNRFDEAERAFSRELELNPNDELAQYHLALTFIERKIEPEKTVKILETAIGLKYDYADARYQLGKILLERSEVEKAIENLEIAAASDANRDFIHYQLSIAYRRAGRKEDADRELKRYQELKAANRQTDSLMGNRETTSQP